MIAGLPPIHLLAQERKNVFDRKPEVKRDEAVKAAKAKTLQTWQQLWMAETTGRWTARLIPDLVKWTGRQHGETDFYLTQFLTGHGCFNAYLHKMAIMTTPNCAQCSSHYDDAHHTFFECNRWSSLKQELETNLQIEVLTPDNIMNIMLSEKDRWDKIVNYVTAVLKDKRKQQTDMP